MPSSTLSVEMSGEEAKLFQSFQSVIRQASKFEDSLDKSGNAAKKLSREEQAMPVTCCCGRSIPAGPFRWQLCRRCQREAREREEIVRRRLGIPAGMCYRCQTRPARHGDILCSRCLGER